MLTFVPVLQACLLLFSDLCDLCGGAELKDNAILQRQHVRPAHEWIHDKIAYRGGVFTNYDLARIFKSGDSNQVDHVNFAGFSGGIGIHTGLLEFSLGLVLQGGEGKAQIVANTTSYSRVLAASANIIVGMTYKR